MSIKIAPDYIQSLLPHQVFVFGSNTQGRHGAGAAKIAKTKFGAIYGQAEGLQGQSYGVVTKDLAKGTQSIPLPQIEAQIIELLKFAETHPELEFLVTQIGCGLGGYQVGQIAELFKGKVIPINVALPKAFIEHLI